MNYFPLVPRALAKGAICCALFTLASLGFTAFVGSSSLLINGGEADFGYGTHRFGAPAGSAGVYWHFIPFTSVTLVRAEVKGTLYVDRLFGAGKAQARIRFLDLSNVDLRSPMVFDICGPGFDANKTENQLSINVSYSHLRLRKVQIEVASGPCSGPLTIQATRVLSVPELNERVVIDAGTADFGQPHLPDLVSIRLDPYLNEPRAVEGKVLGFLKWDSISPGCARMIVDFLDINNVVLGSRTLTECSSGGLSSDEPTFVQEYFLHSGLYKVRIRLGTLLGSQMVNVVERTYSLGQLVGTVELTAPTEPIVANRDFLVDLRWFVPEPLSWRTLKAMSIRFVDGDRRVIMQLHWDESANTFSQVNPRTGHQSPPRLPGTKAKYETAPLQISLDKTRVVGSGPAGQSVLLQIALKFKPFAKGKLYDIEVSAEDDAGVVQAWSLAGSLSVDFVAK